MSAGTAAAAALRLVAAEEGGVEELLQALDAGMYDEWDIGLVDGLTEGFGGFELQLAARSGASSCDWHAAHDPGGSR